MIEIFKTNVTDPSLANRLVEELRKVFSNYEMNFDLEDCDRILRVKSDTGEVQSSALISLLKKMGCQAEILPDAIPGFNKIALN
jgi:hypothetical protein